MKKESMDDISKLIKEGMDQIIKEQGEDPAQATSISKGRAFTEFYIKDIARYLGNNITDEESISRGLECDGSKDIGIDFIYEKEGNEFWVYQSKYVGKRTPLTKDTIAGFFQIHRRIFNKEERAEANRWVRDLLPVIGSNPSITFVLLTNGKASEDNHREFNRMRYEASKDENADIYTWQLVDLSKIKENRYEVISSANDKYPAIVNIPIPKGRERYINLSDQVSTEEKDYRTIITVISGSTLKDLCKRYKNGLFNLNIRGFLGNKGKNKKITETLDSEPGLFYLYNNGISAICTEMNIHDSGKHVEIECKEFSIINGAQTVCSIGDFDDTEKLKQVMVLIRITQAEKTKSDKGLNRKIVEYNNTQNVIRDADFRSNDEVQKMLQTLFENGKYQYNVGKPPYKFLEYMRKRGMPRKGKKPVSVEDMAKSLYAFNIAFGGQGLDEDPAGEMYPLAKDLFDESDNGYYRKLFGHKLDENKAAEFAAIAMLNIYLNERLRKDAKNHEPDTANGMTYRSGRHFLRAFGYIVRSFYSQDDRKRIYKRVIAGDAFKEGGFVPMLYKEVANVISDTISYYESEGDNSFNFKAWLRSSKKVKFLVKRIDNLGGKDGLPKI